MPPSIQSSAAGQRLVVVGFHLLVAFWILNAFFPSRGFSVTKVSVSLLLLASVSCFAIHIFAGVTRRGAERFGLISRVLLGLLFFWCMITILRGLTSDTGRLFTLLANPEIGGLVWLLPFAVYMGRQPGVLPALLPSFRLHATIGMIFTAATIYEVGFAGVSPRDSNAQAGLLLIYAAPFALLTGIGTQSDRRIYAAGLAMAAVAHFILGNRASFAMALGILLLSLAFGRVRRGPRIVLRMAALGLIIIVLAMLTADHFHTNLGDDWLVDTRTFLWEEMSDDFSSTDWLIGRGALGEYYSPYFDYISRIGGEGDSPYRQVNEIGYLHIVLKAGLIGSILYSIVVFWAIYKSRSIQDRRFAIGLMVLLILHLTEMTVVGQASFQPSRVLLWMLIGVGLSSTSYRKNRVSRKPRYSLTTMPR